MKAKIYLERTMKLSQNKNILIFPQMQSYFYTEWVYIHILDIYHQTLPVNKWIFKKYSFQQNLYIYLLVLKVINKFSHLLI